jgi:hypothetical protein
MPRLSVSSGLRSNRRRNGGSELERPSLLVAPSLTGSFVIGEVVSVSRGTWQDAVSFTYQWCRDGVFITGATANEYTPTALDDQTDLTCRVTALNEAGATSAIAPARVVTWAAPTLTGTLFDEILDEGTGLIPIPTAQVFGGDALTYGVTGQAVTIDPATGIVEANTDVLVAGELITVSASNSGGTVSTAFLLTIEDMIPPPPEGEIAPGGWSFSDRQTNGELVIDILALPYLDQAVLTGFEYRLDGGDAMALPDGAATGTRVISAPNGVAVSAEIRAMLSTGPALWSDPKTATPTQAQEVPVFDALPEVETDVTVGDVLEGDPGVALGEPTPEIYVRWLRNGVEIPGASSETYEVVEADLGAVLTLEVTATNPAGSVVRVVETAPVKPLSSLWEMAFFDPEDVTDWRTTYPQAITEWAPASETTGPFPAGSGSLKIRTLTPVPGNEKPFAFIDLKVEPNTNYKFSVRGAGKTGSSTWNFELGTATDTNLNMGGARSGGSQSFLREYTSPVTLPSQQVMRMSLRGNPSVGHYHYTYVALENLSGGKAPILINAEGGLSSFVGEAATYYVDYEGGDNNNDGLSEAAPWKTAPVVVVPGTVIKFKGGVRYRETITVNGEGEPGNPVIYDGNTDGSWGTGPAIIDGGKILDNWTAEGGGFYSRDWPGRNVLNSFFFQDNQQMGLAQLPAPANLEVFLEVNEYATADNVTATTVTAPAFFAQFTTTPLTDGAVVRVWDVGNFVYTFAIVAYDAATGTITFDNTTGFKPYTDPAKWRFAIANHPDCMTVPGQWYRSGDGTRLFARPYGDVDPATVTIDAASQSNGFVAEQDYVEIRGFHITKLGGGAGISSAKSSLPTLGCRFEDNLIDRCSVTYGILMRRHQDSVAARNVVQDLADGRGIFVSSAARCVIRENTCQRCADTQMSLYGTTDCIAIGNYIGRRKRAHSNGVSCYLGNKGMKFVFNTILMDSGAGLTMQNSTGSNMIALNTIVTASGITMGLWRPSTNGATEHAEHFIANNVILSSGTGNNNQALNFQGDMQQPGTALINNICDGMNGRVDTRFSSTRALFLVEQITNGAGYPNNQSIYAAGGSFGNPARLLVRGVENGGVTIAKQREAGGYEVLPPDMANVEFRTEDGTSGTGATFSMIDKPSSHSLRTGNVHMRLRQSFSLSATSIANVGDMDASGFRESVFTDVSGTVPENWDLRPSGSVDLSGGSSWTLMLDRDLIPEFPEAGITISHIGRFRPDGTEVWDWTT